MTTTTDFCNAIIRFMRSEQQHAAAIEAKWGTEYVECCIADAKGDYREDELPQRSRNEWIIALESDGYFDAIPSAW